MTPVRSLRRDIYRLMRDGQRGWLKTYLLAAIGVARWGKAIPVPRWGLRRRLVKHRLMFRIRNHTTINYARLHSLYDLFEEQLRAVPGGDIAECGVYKGGSAALLAAASQTAGHQGRIWLFDSFRGLPPPGSSDETWRGSFLKAGDLLASEEDVCHLLFERLRLDPCRFQIVPGWFEQTLPRNAGKIDSIAILHLDCDYYDSVMTCLRSLYDRVRSNGLIVIDDYHYFKGCRQAVDEFLQQRGIRTNLRPTDRFGVYYTKPGETE
jgi:O-methyltransferase